MAQATADAGLDASLLGRMVAVSVDTLAWLAVWLAIALPATYLPLLGFGHLDTAAGFIAVNVLMIAIGQRHGQGSRNI